ncbi:MAG: MFS transporter [Actinomycetes bacterium]
MTTQPIRSIPAPVTRRMTRPAPEGLLLAAVFLIALNLRAGIASIPPLIPVIETDLHLSGAAAGGLTALPVLCMGVFAPVGQRLAHRLGREQTITIALVALVAGLAIRWGSAQVGLLYLGTLVAGVGIAIIGTLLPGLVKEFFAARSGVITGMYMFAMMAGAAGASALAVPLARLTGSWPASLAVWAVLGLASLVLWVLVAARAAQRSPRERARVPSPRLPWRSATAWLLAVYLAVQSWEFYSQLSWLPASYEAHGFSAGRAGLLLAVYTLAQIVSGSAGPAFSDRVRDRRVLLAGFVLASVIALAAITLVPMAAPWVWVTLLGLGQGAAFSIALVYLVDYARDPATSARLTAMAFLVSYSVAAIGPAVVGYLRDVTGGFTVPWTVLLGLSLVELALVWPLRPGRQVGP